MSRVSRILSVLVIVATLALTPALRYAVFARPAVGLTHPAAASVNCRGAVAGRHSGQRGHRAGTRGPAGGGAAVCRPSQNHTSRTAHATQAIPNCTGTYTIAASPIPVGGTAQLLENTSTGTFTGSLSISNPIPSSGTVQGTVLADGSVSGTMKIVALGNSPIPFTGQANADCSSAALVASVLGLNDNITLTRQSTPPTNTPTPVPPTKTPTKTPIPPTNTPTKTPVAPTNTPTKTPVAPTNTPTKTPTGVPATHTPTPVVPTNTPTKTSVPPTNTPTQVPPTNTPTSTGATATPTKTPFPCVTPTQRHPDWPICTVTPTPTETSVPPTPTPTSTSVTSAVISINPAQASMMQHVTVSGAGFAANQTVKIFWDTTSSLPLAHVASSGGGSFTVNAYIPQAPKGTHTIIAKDKQSQQVAKVTITVLPTVFLLHSSGKAGSLQVLWVDGFAGHEQVTATWQPGSVNLGTAKTGSLGGFALFKGMLFHVPNVAAGQYQITVVGAKSNATASATFTVT